MSITAINLPSEYGFCLGSIGFIGFVQLFLGSKVMVCRKPFKSKDYLEKKEVVALREEHKKTVGGTINGMGYPDMGSGRYAAHLSYEEWLNLNNAQRAHGNMLEASGPILACIIVGGFFQPAIVGALGFIWAVSRLIYASGYTSKKGADGRILGAMIGAIASLSLYSIPIYYGARTAFKI